MSGDLLVPAGDYPILKRQIAKLRSEFADLVYSASEPDGDEARSIGLPANEESISAKEDQ